MPHVEASLRRSFEFAATVCAGIAAGLGLCALVAWILRIPALDVATPVLGTTSPTTALALLLAGTAAWLRRAPKNVSSSAGQHRAARALSIALLVIAGIGVTQYMIGPARGIGELLAISSPSPSFLSLACMLLLGFALLMGDARTSDGQSPAQWAALVCIPLPLIGLLDVLVIPLVTTTGMPAISALGFLCVALAITFAEPNLGVMRLITANRPAGQILRRLLPICIVLPFIVTAMRYAGEWAGLIGRSEGGLAAAVIFIVAMAVIIYWFAVSLDVMDARRHTAEESLRSAIRDLEKRNIEMVEANRSLAELYQRSHQLERSLRELSSRLLRTQDEERRRLARELHDSAGQILAAIGMNLSTVQDQAGSLPATARDALDESAELLQSATREIRTLSYLLHPPLLDEAGLNAALRWFVEGFEERSNIKVSLQMPQSESRLPQDVETAIFRIVQESLTNIHRHSGSETAQIRLARSSSGLTLEVSDRGRGIPAEVMRRSDDKGRLGVGILGMRERVTQLGGTLDIESSDGAGTIVRASLPAPDQPPASVRAMPTSLPQ